MVVYNSEPNTHMYMVLKFGNPKKKPKMDGGKYIKKKTRSSEPATGTDFETVRHAYK